MRKPKWLLLSDEILWPVIGMGLAVLDQRMRSSPTRLNQAEIPYTALLHFAHCLETSMKTNEEGKHSVAICLVRQCVEAITLIDIGLQENAYADPLLMAWKAGKKSHGELRASLQKNIWHQYGSGLWDEPWSDFFKNLAQAVQPYAHYSEELRHWQFATIWNEDWVESQNTKPPEALQMTGLLGAYDPLKASRITLLHCLLGWALARLLLANGESKDVAHREHKINELGSHLARSKLLFHKQDWGIQLRGMMLFRPGVDWLDE